MGLTHSELKTACCVCAAGTGNEDEAEQSFEVARAWLEENPIACGCSERDVAKHRRKCERYVVAARQQACGVAFSGVLLWLIGQVIAALFEHWLS